MNRLILFRYLIGKQVNWETTKIEELDPYKLIKDQLSEILETSVNRSSSNLTKINIENENPSSPDLSTKC